MRVTQERESRNIHRTCRNWIVYSGITSNWLCRGKWRRLGDCIVIATGETPRTMDGLQEGSIFGARWCALGSHPAE